MGGHWDTDLAAAPGINGGIFGGGGVDIQVKKFVLKAIMCEIVRESNQGVASDITKHLNTTASTPTPTVGGDTWKAR